MPTTHSFIGRVGRRTALAAVGGVAVVAVSVSIAVAAVSSGRDETPAPAATSAPAAPATPPASDERSTGTAPDDAAVPGRDDMSESDWGREDDTQELSNNDWYDEEDGTEMGETGMEMGDG